MTPPPGHAIAPHQRAAAAQRDAADPAASAWVEASAGSGKTKVLTDRVLRLLLAPGQRPERLLCLTFTKAAAAEMRNRLAARLGAWAVSSEPDLEKSLAALGASTDAATRARARQLFAAILDLPGGMRIATVHAFAQSLLRNFPLEAELPPRFSVLEDADSRALLTTAREAVLAAGPDSVTPIAGMVNAEQFAEIIATLDGDRQRIEACLAAANGPAGLALRLAALCGLDAEDHAAAILAEHFAALPGDLGPTASGRANHAKKPSRDHAEKLRGFLADPAATRPARWADWVDLFHTKEATDRALLADAPALVVEADRIRATQARLCGVRLRDATAALIAIAAPTLARYASAKRRAGLLDYDDLISAAQRVLKDPGSAWVLFKLDGGLDHVLLDEAQDTNPAQWGIAAALTEEFFAGIGTDRDGPRTVFAVGDVKQSIYGFQGADPAGFARWRGAFHERAGAAGEVFREIRLDVSFRSTAPVLALVDAVFAREPARIGVVRPDDTLRHFAHRAGQAGEVEVWPAFRAPAKPPATAFDVPVEPVEMEDAPTRLAEALAARIAAMIRHETLPARDRPIRAGDILVLVRKRTAFSRALVRALKRAGVAVGGLDRMVLVEQLGVQDLLALCDVLLLPEDDLQLAALLRGPLAGLSEDALFELCHPRTGSLWTRLLAERGATTPAGRVVEWLARLADRADLVTPHALLAEILGEASLVGTTGRARLLARLGPDAAEPLDEVLNAALAYQRRHPPSLQGFVHWLRRGGAEVKREPEGAGDAVRVMTVHNAKGLQAPVVVLVDVGPGGMRETLAWAAAPDGTEFPLWAPNKDCRAPAFLAAQQRDQAADLEEEHRLLYVALTRAEDRLLVCGWHPAKKTDLRDRWHTLVEAGCRALPGVVEEPFDPAAFGGPENIDTGGSPLLRLRAAQAPGVAALREPVAVAAAATPLPGWAARPAPPEAAATALQPSALPGETEAPAAAPHGLADPTGRRFRRGRLVHALLQHLPDRPPAERAGSGATFLARPGHALAPDEQAAVLAETLALLEAPALAAAFAPGSLAEAPIAGRVGGIPIAGQVDRLAIGADRVLVVDFKTNRPPPASPAAVPPLYLRQMAAYRAVLRQAFPGRRIDCALVWTYGASLMTLPDALLDRHAPATLPTA